MTEQIEIEMNAARVCDAIARIGYKPESAIMDIVDNSVAAGATRVLIEIQRLEGTTFARKKNVDCYRIYDNGTGMCDTDIINALKLGSDANYPPGSLSKYGMGLKSAGFSLGSSISVLSYQNGQQTKYSSVDRDVIEKMGKYVIGRADATNEQSQILKGFLDGENSGTLIEIGKAQTRQHQSAKKTIAKLAEKLGITYFSFLVKEHGALTIIIRCTGQKDLLVTPVDILFENDAYGNFDPDTYDARRPVITVKDEVPIPDAVDLAPMKLTVALFPKSKMATSTELTEEEREKIKGYQITRANKGVFIYRNDRLIRWGDSLDGLIHRDHIGLRARLELITEHDDFLHVDVSKQRLDMPDSVWNRLDTLLRRPRREHAMLFEICDDVNSPKEGEAFNDRNMFQAEEDYDEPETSPSEQKKRRSNLATRTKEKADKNEDEEPTTTEVDSDGKVEGNDTPTESHNENDVFRKIRYSDKIRGFALWDTGWDSEEGTFVRVNKNHSFYPSVLSQLGEDSAVRQAFEAIMWSSAAAENITLEKLNLSEKDIISVLEKFKKALAINLDNWCVNNQDLFDAN